MKHRSTEEDLLMRSSSSSVHSDDARLVDDIMPQPMEGLHETGPPPFLSKTYDFVEDSDTNDIVSWSRGNNSFIVCDPQTFAMNILPRYFKHSNFSSYVRQLNTYGFKKVDPDKWEFANEGFLRGQKHLLKNIKRKKTTSNFQASNQGFDPCVEVGRFGLDAEIDRLKRDKQVLMVELVKLRQQQQQTNLKEMEQRLKGTELKRRQTMSFLAKVIKNPTFLQQQKDKMKEIEEAMCRKRMKRIDHGDRACLVDDHIGINQELGQGEECSNAGFGDFVGGENDICVKLEPQEFGGFDVEFEALAMNMQEPLMDMGDDQIVHKVDDDIKDHEESFDDGFWGDLILKLDSMEEVIQAWYMDDSDEDQRLPHHRNPKEFVSSFEKLDELGVLSWRLDADNYETDPELKKIREERGYSYTDFCEVCPEKLPKYEEKIKNFFEEHLHTDEEIRYCVAGSGYFDVRDRDESWIRIWVKKGAMIVLPAGIYHRFTLDSDNYIKAMRLFVGDPVWTPYNRPHDHLPARKEYVENFVEKAGAGKAVDAAA